MRVEKTGDFYDLLGVHNGASDAEIRAKYHELAKLFHPDRVPTKDKDIAHRVFVRINQAYSTLIDTERRERYDQRLATRKAAQAQAAAKAAAPPAPPPPPPATAEEIREWMREATASFQHGDMPAAHSYCRRLIKSGKAPMEAYVLIGDIYIYERQKNKALTAYRVALKMQPDNKMLQAKVRRMEEILFGYSSIPAPAPPPSGGEGEDTKRSFITRIAEMRSKKQ